MKYHGIVIGTSLKPPTVNNYKTRQNRWNNYFQASDNRQCRAVILDKRNI